MYRPKSRQLYWRWTWSEWVQNVQKIIYNISIASRPNKFGANEKKLKLKFAKFKCKNVIYYLTYLIGTIFFSLLLVCFSLLFFAVCLFMNDIECLWSDDVFFFKCNCMYFLIKISLERNIVDIWIWRYIFLTWINCRYLSFDKVFVEARSILIIIIRNHFPASCIFDIRYSYIYIRTIWLLSEILSGYPFPRPHPKLFTPFS